jgi:hypothetical protein
LRKDPSGRHFAGVLVLSQDDADEYLTGVDLECLLQLSRHVREVGQGGCKIQLLRISFGIRGNIALAACHRLNRFSSCVSCPRCRTRLKSIIFTFVVILPGTQPTARERRRLMQPAQPSATRKEVSGSLERKTHCRFPNLLLGQGGTATRLLPVRLNIVPRLLQRSDTPARPLPIPSVGRSGSSRFSCNNIR